MTELNDEQKSLLAAGMVVGILGTVGALMKTAMEQAAKKSEDSSKK